MAPLPLPLLVLLAHTLAAARALPLVRRQFQDEPSSVDAPAPGDEANDGHLDSQWIIVIAVIISVVVLGVIATMLWVRLRRRRRGRAASPAGSARASSPYDCVRQHRQAPASRKTAPPPDPITTPLPALTYQRLRDSSTSSLSKDHHR